jgi:hypothetical protein
MGFFSKPKHKHTPPPPPVCNDPTCPNYRKPMTRFDEPGGGYRFSCTAPYCGNTTQYQNEVRR